MKDIVVANQSVAGHKVSLLPDKIILTKGEKYFCLGAGNNKIDFFIDDISSSIESKNFRYKVSGWAYDRDTVAPLKSIYVIHQGRLIARAKHLMRIDVRIQKNLSFDHCGFECSFDVPPCRADHYIFSLLMVSELGSRIYHLKAETPSAPNKHKAHAPQTTILDIPVSHTALSKFEHQIETASLDKNKIFLSGWCFFTEDPATDIYVALICNGVPVSEVISATIDRPDVALQRLHNAEYHFYGFEINSIDMGNFNSKNSELILNIAFVAPAKKVAELYAIK